MPDTNKTTNNKTKLAVIVAIPVLIVCIVATVLFNKVIIPNNKYNEASELIGSKKYAEAIALLSDIADYKDSKNKLLYIWGKIAVRDTVSAGDDAIIGLKKDGTVIALGYDRETMSNYDVSSWTDILSVSAGSSYVSGLKKDGKVIVAGNTKYIKGFEDWSDIVSISAHGHIVGLKIDGTVVAAGGNYDGECEVGTWNDIIAVAAGGSFTAGLKGDGTVVIAGGKPHDSLIQAEKWSDIVSISAGKDHIVGLKKDGTVLAAGDNENRQCDIKSWSDISAISAGTGYTIGLKKDGKVVSTDDVNHQASGKITNWEETVAISAGGSVELKQGSKYYYSDYDQLSLGLKKDGTVRVISPKYGYEDIKDWKEIKLPNAE